MQCRITSASPGGKTESLVDSDAAGAATPQDLLLLVDRLKTNQKQSRAVIEGSYLNGFRCFLWLAVASRVYNLGRVSFEGSGLKIPRLTGIRCLSCN
ncbi:hypothetical protein AFLA_007151 [Aspergillus flavus NRRL3357]|nr:hypothetical protein AFLA_007151 [Aspergillus flavus NRRL3357]